MNSKKVVKIPTLQIIPVIGFIIGLVFFMVGMGDFGFWNHDTNTPTEGFFPIIIATGLIIFSIMAFLQNIRKGGVEYRLLNWYVPLGFVGLLAGIMVIGTVPAVIIFEILWCRFYEKLSWKVTIIATIFCLIMVVPIFTWWLTVDFPIGIIGNLIMGY